MSYAGLADIYAGALLNGVKHGQGILVSRDGSYYEGGWTNGTEQGQGGIKSWPIREKERLEPRLAEVAGGKYTGEFFRGNAQGKGVRSWTEGPLAQCKYDGRTVPKPRSTPTPPWPRQHDLQERRQLLWAIQLWPEAGDGPDDL